MSLAEVGALLVATIQAAGVGAVFILVLMIGASLALDVFKLRPSGPKIAHGPQPRRGARAAGIVSAAVDAARHDRPARQLPALRLTGPPVRWNLHPALPRRSL